ncbi:MAG: Asp-tRNA(Asn)/Glu-tRNA(Gln) amidotransferase subunit GatB [Myxococcota bacterium]|jgi:aspartyl-tRNA(Asn)/glutamyl-tRNA(Gln) amidotransferase subunit B|nr:Asp-tRNA(Asn)/Glu-tRNA(Gln) amidotransferase subunit GatB [Myxococcota bacterium]
MNYEPVIGLEVHAQLRTKSKLFAPASTTFGASPNANTSEICLGMPGVLPVLNDHAVQLAVRAALGLNCTVHQRSQWSRKHYFYPDLPKGYQISQYDRPIATDGHLKINLESGEKIVRIERIHMEEDAGKNVHDSAITGNRSYVDFNRAGIPLVEIVTKPDIHSPEEASTYMKALRQILRYLWVCDGNMEEGSLRCDANVSIKPIGQKELGTRTELKNINSFRFVSQAIQYEILRQAEVLDRGEKVTQETRLWDSQAKMTRSMRSKEEAHDYRYFPDPDLPDLILEEKMISEIRTHMPELPAEKILRYTQELELSEYDAFVLCEDADVAEFFEAAINRHHNSKTIANWVINDVLRAIKGQPLSALSFSGEDLGTLVSLIDNQTISGKIAKDVFQQMLATGENPEQIVESKGLKQLTNQDEIESIIDDILTKNPENIDKYKAGNTKLLGFFVGQVMQQTSGKANPKLVNELLQKKLS